MKKHITFSLLICLIFITSVAHAAITSVTLTPAPPTTMSNGRSYYAAGVTYTFRIQATDVAATGKAYWHNTPTPPRTIVVAFPGGSSFYIDLNSPGADTYGGTGIVVDSVNDNSGGVYTAIDYTAVVRFRWDCTAVAAGGNNIVATVTANNGATSGTSTRTFNFGVISDFQILNFNQTGEAADGRINPWHSAFTVTGTMVYFSAGESISTPVPAGEVSSVNLYLWRGAVNVSTIAPQPAPPLPGMQYNIGASYFATTAGGVLGNYTWDVRVTMLAPGTYPKQSANTLVLNCDRVQVDTFTFENGGGVNAPYYLRSVNVSGTRIRIRAFLQNGGGPMVGNTFIRIRDDQATPNYYDLQINGGQNEGTVLISPMPTVADLNNIAVNYTVVAVYGSAYDPATAPPAPALPASGQNDSTRIVNSGPFTCRWENHHPPGYDTALPAKLFTVQTGTIPPQSTATSFILEWTALSTGAPSYDADFYSYRIYFRRQTPPATPFVILDRDAPACPTCPAVLGNIGAGTISFTVGGPGAELTPLITYEYYISAVDIFGNEVLVVNQITGTVATQATQIEVSVSDGISQASHNSLVSSRDPATHLMRHTAIKLTTRIVTAETPPDQVNIIVASNDSDVIGPGPGGQWGVTGTNDDIRTLPASGLGQARWTIPCTRVGANTYEGYIPSDHPLVRNDGNIRMIVETIKGGTPTYTDSCNIPACMGLYWLNEWRFRVGQPAIFIPWPTRILNNVLTAQMPCCFPAFFLAVDSLVTIKVYDVKGRVIATLCDRLYRPGGQNIKDLGWCGRNKENRRVGPGLYYIHINAVTFGNKTVLDKKLKVVVRH